MSLRIFVISFAVVLVAVPMPVTSQTEQRLAQVEVGVVEPAVIFNKAAGELPEGVVMDNAGNLYVSLPPLGQVRKVDKYGVETLFVTIGTPPFPAGSPGPLGLEVDVSGNVYVAVDSSESDSHGVWRISPDGVATRLPGSQAIAFPNGLAFDEVGNLYVTDSLLVTQTGLVGRVWRIPPEGTAEVWSDDPLLAGVPSPFTQSLGANGIAYLRGRVLVANSTQMKIVQIPVLPDGSAGTAEVVASMDHFLASENVPPLPPAVQVPPLLDGLTVDSGGNIYAAVAGQHKLVRLPPDGSSLAVLADFTDGLQIPASLAFGTTRGTRPTLFITNFAFLDGLNNAAVLKVDVGIPGPPVISQPLLPED